MLDLSTFNTQQAAAVSSKYRYVRVIAGAGSGKTRVLVGRILYLIDEMNVKPYQIWAITFTNKAARVMNQRLEDDLARFGVSNRPVLTTIHSMCLRILREDIFNLDFPKSFVIIDTDDQLKIVKKVYKSYSDTFAIKPAEMLNYISSLKTREINVEDAKEHFGGNNKTEDFKLEIYEQYQNILNQEHYLDFDDLLMKVSVLFERFPDIRRKWQNRLTHLLVDEFQDVNDLQYKIIKFLLNERTSLFIVGDPDQTIYTWRGANVNLILNFPKDFSNATGKVDEITQIIDAQNTYFLNVNYRSTENILNAANELITNNANRIPKDLTSNLAKGEKINYFTGLNSADEAEFIVREIQDLKRRNAKVKNKDILILIRSAYLSRAIETALIGATLPYKLYGGTRFFERREIKDCVALLRLIAHKEDRLAFLRVLETFPFKIGEKTIQVFEDLAYEKQLDLFSAFKLNIANLKPIQRNNITAFFNSYDKALEINKEQGIVPALKSILNENSYLEDLIKNEETERYENVIELFSYLSQYLITSESDDLDSLIQDISILSSQDEIQDQDHISVMTIHVAKGLEYPVVFVVGLCEFVFPSYKAISGNNIEEERRLAYVAFTRAQDYLYLTNNAEHNFTSGQQNQPSRFIDEIKDHLNQIYNPALNRKANPRHRSYFSHSEKSYNENPTTIEVSDFLTAKPAKTPFVNQASLYKTGDKIVHDKFGPGVVLSCNSDTVTITFNNGDKKDLYAFSPKLRKE
jgi:DNA helicase-2/ATP-dependent DNA helicase PcrA